MPDDAMTSFDSGLLFGPPLTFVGVTTH